MDNDAGGLGGHFTMLLDGECFTFDLPPFHRTGITDWLPGAEGAFWQEPWTRAEVEEWKRRAARHEASSRRWRWLRRVTLNVPWRYRDEDNGAWWGRSPLGTVLADRIIRRHPGPSGSHLIARNVAQSYALMHTEGVTFCYNTSMGYPGAGLAVSH